MGAVPKEDNARPEPRPAVHHETAQQIFFLGQSPLFGKKQIYTKKKKKLLAAFNVCVQELGRKWWIYSRHFISRSYS